MVRSSETGAQSVTDDNCVIIFFALPKREPIDLLEIIFIVIIFLIKNIFKLNNSLKNGDLYPKLL